ncbi:MAG: 50S ribosomal protein L22 [Planctomycetota bacterium]|nr:50S ribosomal protein L22 [Planctomycetota bacterium]
MPYPAVHRYARIAPRKARLVADMIRGLAVDQAMTALDFSKKRGAWYYKAVLKSALANAEEADADVARLFVRESRVDEGPTIKRFQPKDRGRAHPIMKRTSHLHIVLDERT